MAFAYAVNRILTDWEKFYANNTDDPGGETIWGLASNYHALEVRRMKEMLKQGISRELVKQYAISVYKKKFWDKAHCNVWPDGVNIYVFDMAIQHGTRRVSIKDRGAIDLLQEAAGAKPDGIIGPQTKRAIKKWQPLELLDECHAVRTMYYTGLEKWPNFGRGWMNRISEVYRISIQYALATEMMQR